MTITEWAEIAARLETERGRYSRRVEALDRAIEAIRALDPDSDGPEPDEKLDPGPDRLNGPARPARQPMRRAGRPAPRSYTEAEKAEAVALKQKVGTSAAAAQLGIHPSLLWRWEKTAAEIVAGITTRETRPDPQTALDSIETRLDHLTTRTLDELGDELAPRRPARPAPEAAEPSWSCTCGLSLRDADDWKHHNASIANPSEYPNHRLQVAT